MQIRSSLAEVITDSQSHDLYDNKNNTLEMNDKMSLCAEKKLVSTANDSNLQ